MVKETVQLDLVKHILADLPVLQALAQAADRAGDENLAEAVRRAAIIAVATIGRPVVVR
jgi:hypothetical protein